MSRFTISMLINCQLENSLNSASRLLQAGAELWEQFRPIANKPRARLKSAPKEPTILFNGWLCDGDDDATERRRL